MKLLSSLFCVLALSSCGLMNIAEETRDKVAATADKMDTTNEKLDRAQAELLKTNALLDLVHKDGSLNSAYNSFLAVKANDPRQLARDMGGPADIFIHSSSDEKILRLFFKFKDEAMQVENLLTGKANEPGDRWVKMMAAGAIAAYLPQERFENLIKSQVDTQDIYEGVVYSIATLRFAYTRDYLIAYKMKDDFMVSVSNLRDTLRLLENMEKVAQLPFQDRLTPIVFPGLDNMPVFDADKVEAVDVNDLRAKAAEVQGKFSVENTRLQNDEAKAMLEKLGALAR